MSESTERIGTVTEEIVNELRDRTDAVKTDLADNYYNKDIINAFMKAGLSTIIVDELPATGTENIVYLVPAGEYEHENNHYKEYLYITDGDTKRWEDLGSTELDFSNYWDKTTIQEKLNLKIDKADVPPIPSKLSDLENDSNFFTLEEVSALPETGESGKVYVVAAGTTYEEDNLYDEYIWYNGKWEHFGYVDAVKHAALDNYYTKAEEYSTAEFEAAVNGLITMLDEAAGE